MGCGLSTSSVLSVTAHPGITSATRTSTCEHLGLNTYPRENTLNMESCTDFSDPDSVAAPRTKSILKLPPIPPEDQLTENIDKNINATESVQGVSSMQDGMKPPVKRKIRVVSEEDIREKAPQYITDLLEAEDLSNKENSAKILFLKTNIVSNSNRTLRVRLTDLAVSLNIIKLFPKVWKRLFPCKFETAECTAQWTVMKNALVILWNGTDCSRAMCEAAVTSNLHTYLLELLQEERLLHGDMENSSILYTVKGIFGTLHNLLQQIDSSRSNLREQDAVNIIKAYRDLGSPMLQCKALFCLAYLIDDSENDMINSDSENFKFLISILDKSLRASDHISRYWGYSSVELVRVINLLAATDSNKLRLVDSGLLEQYVKLLASTNSEDEQFYTATGLYTLAFNDACREAIKKMTEIMEGLTNLSQGDAEERTKKMANGALWLLSGQGNQPTPFAPPAGGDGDGHVMISYNWEYQPLALWIREQLQRAGVPVWMDVDNMSGSILHAMAQAIEKANVILLCYSHKYFLSPNCRLEAEYAFQKRKPFIPVRMEKYDPEDWLGIMIGAKLYFDFSREEKKQRSLEGLRKEIDNVIKGAQTSSLNTITAATASETSSAPTRGDMTPQSASTGPSRARNWTVTQVSHWLEEEGLAAHKNKFGEFNGSLMLEFREMMKDAPEFFYATLRDDLCLSLLDILRFTKALKRL